MFSRFSRLSHFAPAVFIAISLHAPCAAAADDELAALLLERGLINRISSVSLAVADRAADLVINAMGFVGVPYKRGGNSVETGFDCSGFVRAMFEQTMGLLLPRKADAQAAATVTIDKAQLQAGDLVFFNTLQQAFSHVGIYVGNGRFIHSPKPGSQVRLENMQARYWQQRFDGARRVVTAGQSAAGQTQ